MRELSHEDSEEELRGDILLTETEKNIIDHLNQIQDLKRKLEKSKE